MPPRDVIHQAVRAALIKDGWTITADPFIIDYDDLTLYADLAAERPLAAEKAGRKIAVEVKSFIGPSDVRDFETALGQYQLYRGLLEVRDPDRELIMAVSQAIYEGFFQRPAIKHIVRRYEIALLVVNLEREEIVQWAN